MLRSKFVILFHVHPRVHCALNHMNKPDDLVNSPIAVRKVKFDRPLEGQELDSSAAQHYEGFEFRAQGIIPACN